ncbi:MAG: hypothetical protein UY60_C0006G0013 [Parcubacteria group bacterium GW2011_GWB1_50_9]|uniref:Uncharacterized protein n=1 Tax=Candidatus Adlerbacteria bacterium GW2011_GWC1_50_9 TaxID=1618608 RepID=A0A0G1WSE4_9BACT|nr:MAG: hypothetical protein UY60_C0006G0013 [Parcubacteria group bacterium GW2011_GWB1_50_9]KKW21696.1 MAG: hypothetical protein UY61_C0001G0011 [Candidatus Adlerbacteria bacterium GW2011_GWC1_50_9]KKW33726.1 MAG: hypothetical protein UY78_C0004G0011 [Parcubacteria group bacterium GW2011_GWA1_53_13]
MFPKRTRRKDRKKDSEIRDKNSLPPPSVSVLGRKRILDHFLFEEVVLKSILRPNASAKSYLHYTHADSHTVKKFLWIT